MYFCRIALDVYEAEVNARPLRRATLVGGEAYEGVGGTERPAVAGRKRPDLRQIYEIAFPRNDAQMIKTFVGSALNAPSWRQNPKAVGTHGSCWESQTRHHEHHIPNVSLGRGGHSRALQGKEPFRRGAAGRGRQRGLSQSCVSLPAADDVACARTAVRYLCQNLSRRPTSRRVYIPPASSWAASLSGGCVPGRSMCMSAAGNHGPHTRWPG